MNPRLNNHFGQVSWDAGRDPDLTLTEKGLYCYLATYANSKDNTLTVKVDRIATECNISRATVQRILSKLIEKGVIERYRKGGNTCKTTLLR